MIHTGDCLDVMAAMEPESVDARPEAINEHERTCPDCQRVIAEEQAAYDAQSIPASEDIG